MQKPTIRQPFSIILLWIGENIASAIGFKLYDDAVNFIGSLFNPELISNIITGIIGIIAIIAAVIIAIILILYYTKKLRVRYRETSIDVYTKKSGLDLDDFLKKAEKEIHIFGITLETTSGDSIGTIEQKIKSDKTRKVRILLCDPNTPFNDEINELVDSNIGTVAGSLQRLKNLRTKLGKDGKKLEIKTFKGIPIQSMFILDPETNSHGVMRVEPYLYGIPKHDRRIQELSNKNEKSLFKVSWESFNNMWNSAYSIQV